MVCMMLTIVISGKNFQTYDKANAYMNSTIVEYIEGIEVIKAFGRAGVSYEKYAKAITDFRTFVVKWLSSTYVTMKLSFALFPSTLIGTLPVALALANRGVITAPLAALAVMLSISMVGSLAKLEVFSENMRQVEFTVKGLQEFLEMPELPEPKARAVVKSTGVEMKNVHFSYTGEQRDAVQHLGFAVAEMHAAQRYRAVLRRFPVFQRPRKLRSGQDACHLADDRAHLGQIVGELHAADQRSDKPHGKDYDQHEFFRR